MSDDQFNELLKRAAGYLRRSSEKQRENNSFEMQKAAIKICAAENGYEINHWIEDDAVSAFNKDAIKREGVQKLLQLTRNNEIDGLFFYDETRIDRQFNDFVINVVKPIREFHPHIKFFSTNQDGEWDENEPLVQAKLIFSQQESKIKSDRIKTYRTNVLYPTQGENGLKKDSIRPGSRVPYGFQKQKQDFIADPEEADIVAFIFYLDGWGHSNKAISGLLNDCSVPSPTGGKWNPSTIDVILNNVSYLGYYPDSTRKVHWTESRRSDSLIGLLPKVHEPLISSLSWELSLQTRKRKKQLGKNDTPFLLRSLIFCRRCNIPLEAKDKSPANYNGKYQYYLCSGCSNKLSLTSAHESIVTHLFQSIEPNIQNGKSYIKKLFLTWKKQLGTKMEEANEKLKIIQHNRRFLQKDNPLHDSWVKSYDVVEDSFSKTRDRICELLNKAEVLSSENASDEFIARFASLSIDQLSTVELRTLCLTFIERVLIDFQNENKFSIHYRMDPFSSLDNAVGQITENVSSSLV